LEVTLGFRLVPKSAILNDIEQRNGRYFALFNRILQARQQNIVFSVSVTSKCFAIEM